VDELQIGNTIGEVGNPLPLRVSHAEPARSATRRLRQDALSGSVRWMTFVELGSNCLEPALLAAACENRLDDILPVDLVDWLS
jgi:hypothetical protein